MHLAACGPNQTAIRRVKAFEISLRAGLTWPIGEENVEQLSLQLAIAFFAFQVAAWAGLCLYLRAARQRRREEAVTVAITDAPVAQAA